MNTGLIKHTLNQQLYTILKNEIMNGTIPLGSKLTNRELQERFQVSSTPVRDAINKLYQEGLVKELSKAGAEVISFDSVYAQELNEFIASLSCGALQMTIAKGTTAEVTAQLKKYLALQASATDEEGYFDADFRFHKSFFDFCGNQFIKETYKRYNQIRYLLVKYAIRTEGHRSEAMEQHQCIIDAYSQGQYDHAAQLLKDHYDRGLFLINEYWTKENPSASSNRTPLQK